MVPLAFRLLRRGMAFGALVVLSMFSILTNRKVILIVTPFGNLGNRLFLYANIIAFAIEHNAIVINPAFHPWRQVFAGTRRGGLACFPPPPLPHIPGQWLNELAQHFAWVGLSIASSPNSPSQWGAISIDGLEEVDMDRQSLSDWAKQKHVIFVSGYGFLSTLLIQRHADKIRAYFRQVLGNDLDATEPARRLQQTCDLVIGVVIRQGGFDTWMGGKYFFDTSTYRSWICQASELFPNQRVGFFICSDRDLDLGLPDHIPSVFRSGHDLENRATLALCDRIMSPPSSFAGWASLMGSIPFHLLFSKDQRICLDQFFVVRNHPDLVDASYPAPIDRTETVIADHG